MIDTHAHYTDSRFREDIADILSRIDSSDEIEYVIEASTSIEDSINAIELAKNNKKLFALVGIHPSDADEVKVGWEDKLRSLAGYDKVVGIGEIGLDYYYDDVDRDIQKDVLKRQLSIAAELELPVVIHDREAHKDVIDICLESGVRGVFHCYSGSIESAKQLMSKGDWYFSFNGVVTFKNASKVREVVEFIPLDRLLIETDCPYLTPVPYRGKRNDSFLMRETFKAIAELKGISFEELERITKQNTLRLFTRMEAF